MSMGKPGTDMAAMKKQTAAVLAMALACGVAWGDGNPKRFAGYRTEPPPMSASRYDPVFSDLVVAETASHALVRQDAGTSCAAGNFLLFNKRDKTYREVDAGTCDDRGLMAKLTADRLTFFQGKRIVAMYPVYAQ